MKKVILAILIFSLVLGCVEPETPIEPAPIIDGNVGIEDPNNQDSNVGVVKVIFCEDEPQLLKPHCDYPLEEPVSDEKIYFALIVDSLSCRNKRISALCNIKAYDGDKLEYEEIGVSAKDYNQKCVPDYRREAICKMFLAGPVDEETVRTIDFEVIDLYSQESVESKGHVVKLIPKDVNTTEEVLEDNE